VKNITQNITRAKKLMSSLLHGTVTEQDKYVRPRNIRMKMYWPRRVLPPGKSR